MSWLALAIGTALIGAVNALPCPHVPVTARDIGPAGAFAENAQVTVTVQLTLRNAGQLDQLIESVYTTGAPRYHQFLTTEQFREQFAPSATIAAVRKDFATQGLAVTQVATAQLHATGSAAQFEIPFAVQLHGFEAPGARCRARLPLACPARAAGDRKLGAMLNRQVSEVVELLTAVLIERRTS
jgi:subtilase family serine protease